MTKILAFKKPISAEPVVFDLNLKPQIERFIRSYEGYDHEDSSVISVSTKPVLNSVSYRSDPSYLTEWKR